MSYVIIEKQDAVGVVTLDYMEQNRFHPDLMDQFMATLDELEKDDAVGAVVFTGKSEKFFSNGLDLEYLMTKFGDRRAIIDYLGKMNGMFRRVCMYPKPTVGALNGHTFAGGLFLSANMDFRFMREDRGWICMPEVDINIPLLPGMIAICQATMTARGFKRLYFTGERMTGPQAKEIEFVEDVYSKDDLLPKSVEFAAGLAKKKTRTYAEMKRRIREHIAKIYDEVDPGYFLDTLKFSVPQSG